MGASNGCIFCKIVKGEIPCNRIYENNSTLAFLDINPVTKGHCLVLPKSHVDNLEKADESTVVEVFMTVKKVSDLLMEKLEPGGLNVVINNGAVAGQVIEHLHVHLIPRFSGDGIKLAIPTTRASEKSLEELQSRLTGK